MKNSKILCTILLGFLLIPLDVFAESIGCSSPELGVIISVFKSIFNIICIIVPILLIISVVINITKLVNNPEDKKLPKKILNSVIAAIVVFFIPMLINLVVDITYNNSSNSSLFNFSLCWKSSNNASFSSNYIPLNENNKKNIIGNNNYEKGDPKQTDDSQSTTNSTDSSVETSYGVFLGLDHGDGLNKLYKYKLVVIDLQEFSKSDVEKLHNKGIKVYSYLNVGSVEEYRSYYKKFKNIYLGTYENWEDEKWVNVSNKTYQRFIINTLEPSLRAKGADGYFIDNCDVYAVKKNDSIYNGLKTILGSIHKHNLPMLINGGDQFVTRAIRDGSYSSLFDGVNQEEVFTLINFDNHTYHNQSSSDTKYYKNYLSLVKSKGLKVYLLEYGANRSKEKEIKNYCDNNGFSYYNSKSYNLD